MAYDVSNLTETKRGDGGHNNSFYYNECIPCPNGVCYNSSAAFVFGEGGLSPLSGEDEHCDEILGYWNPMLNECRKCSDDIPNCSSCAYHECSDCGAPGYYMTCSNCSSPWYFDDDSNNAPSLCTASATCATSMTFDTNGDCTQIANAIAANIVFNEVPCDNKVWTYAPTMADVSY